MNKETIKALVYLNVASILWGGNVFFGSYLKDYLGPWSIMSVRMVIGSLIFLFLLHKSDQLKGITRLLGWKEVLLIALSGTVAFYLKEKLGRQHWVAAAVSVIGLVFILSKGNLNSLYELSFNKGDMFILGSIFIWAIYSVAAKLAMGKASPLVVTALGILLSTFIVLPLGIYEANYLIKPVINTDVIMAVVFIGVGPTVLSLLFWNKGVMVIGPARASLFLNMVPIYVIVLSSYLLDETLHSYQLIGMVLIIGGSLYANRQKAGKKA